MEQIEVTPQFQQAYDNFKDTTFAKRLRNEFRDKPYHERYRSLYFVSLVASYLFNVISISTGASLVYFFFSGMIHPIMAVTITAALVMVLEIAKRTSTNNLIGRYLQFQQFSWSLFFVVVLLCSISIPASYYGTQKTYTEIAPDFAPIVTDTLNDVIVLQDQITALRSDKKALQTQTNSAGKIYYNVLPAIAETSIKISELETQLNKIRTTQRTDNRTEKIKHNISTQLTAGNVAFIVLLCELLFLLSAFFCKSYRWKSYTQFALNDSHVVTDPQVTKDHSKPQQVTLPKQVTEAQPKTVTFDSERIKALKIEYQKARKTRNSYRSKLKHNKGTDDNNRAKIIFFEGEMAKIQDKIRHFKGDS